MAQTTLRFPDEWLRRIDRVEAHLSTQWSKASRNDALCYLVLKGLEADEAAKEPLPEKKPNGAKRTR